MDFACPRCRESINEEELIEGKCPLCGWGKEVASKRMHQFNYDDIALFYEFIHHIKESTYRPADEHQDINEKGASLLTSKRVSKKDLCCSFKLIPDLLDAVKPKTCHLCGRLHMKIGEKVLEIHFLQGVGRYHVSYTCLRCVD